MASENAIPFIQFNQTESNIITLNLDRFELNSQAKDFLSSLPYDKLGIVAVCGKYRTGKSYLLNKLFVDNPEVQS